MTTFDVETHLYQLLKRYDLKNRIALTGDIYLGNDRPQDSYKEDIVLQCLEYHFPKDRKPTMQELATTGVGQIIIYVPDIYVYQGVEGARYVSARYRLRFIVQEVITAVRASWQADPPHLMILDQKLKPLPEIRQHAVTITVGL
nr:hypothetical protein [uncultured Capnocytophaga sp.]